MYVIGMSLTIDDLPNEIIFGILGTLDKTHLILAGATCRLWRQVLLYLYPNATICITNPIQAAINLLEYKQLYHAILNKLSSRDLVSYSSIKFDAVMKTRDIKLIKKVSRRAPEILRFMFIKAVKTNDIEMLDMLDPLYHSPKILDKMYRCAMRYIDSYNCNEGNDDTIGDVNAIIERYESRGITVAMSSRLYTLARKLRDPAVADLMGKKYRLTCNSRIIQELILNNNIPMLSWWIQYSVDAVGYISLYRYLCTSVEFAKWVHNIFGNGGTTRDALDYVFDGLLGCSTMVWFLCEKPVLNYLIGSRKLSVINLKFLDKLSFMKKGYDHIINVVDTLSNLPLGYRNCEGCIIYNGYKPDSELSTNVTTAPPTRDELMASVLYSGIRNNTFDILNRIFPSDEAIKPYIGILVRLVGKRWGVIVNREAMNWLNQFESARRVCPNYYRRIGSIYAPRIMATCIFLRNGSWLSTRNVIMPHFNRCVLL